MPPSCLVILLFHSEKKHMWISNCASLAAVACNCEIILFSLRSAQENLMAWFIKWGFPLSIPCLWRQCLSICREWTAGRKEAGYMSCDACPRKHLLNAADRLFAECLPGAEWGLLSIFRRSVNGGIRGNSGAGGNWESHSTFFTECAPYARHFTKHYWGIKNL